MGYRPFPDAINDAMPAPEPRPKPTYADRARDLAWACLGGLGAAVASVAASALILFVIIYPTSQPPGCDERKILTRAISVGGAWAATLFENICSDGGFVTYASNTVEIARPDAKMSPMPSDATAFAMESDADQRPLALAWTGPRRLEITLPNEVRVGLNRSSFADATVIYKYVPDDPVERACLKQWRALPGDEIVRRSLSASENLTVFLAKCHAAAGPK
jgi:hypothetical protein